MIHCTLQSVESASERELFLGEGCVLRTSAMQVTGVAVVLMRRPCDTWAYEIAWCATLQPYPCSSRF
eukprot:scaffold7234_cov335-Prasinococcus_capsulatus_cf.AAC.13